jgi:hypothetical protein
MPVLGGFDSRHLLHALRLETGEVPIEVPIDERRANASLAQLEVATVS